MDLPDDPLPFAYGAARLCLRNAQRSARRQERLAARIAAVDPPAEAAPAPDDSDGELTTALGMLRPDDAELLRLWAWEQLTAAEIATVLGITPNAAGIRLHRARQRLREKVGKVRVASGHEQPREGRWS